MSRLEKMENRWVELLGLTGIKRTPEELKAYNDEILLLAKQIDLERAKEYSGLITELAETDIEIESIWDLVNTRAKYPKAIPILLKYLPKVEYFRSKEGFVRALTVKEAKGVAVPILIDEYQKASKEHKSLRWAIGNAVNITITKAYANDLIKIVLDKENGFSRDMFINALGKIKTEESKIALQQLLKDNDPLIRKTAEKILKKFK